MIVYCGVKVKDANLSKTCTCAGTFATLSPYTELRQNLLTFRNIAAWVFTTAIEYGVGTMFQ